MNGKVKDFALKATAEEVMEELLRNDFDFWFQKLSMKEAREKVQVNLQKKVSAYDFKVAKYSCRWFRKQRRPGPSNNMLLSDRQWKSLARAVREVAAHLEGRTMAEIVAIVCTRKKTNEQQLRGLVSHDRVWEQSNP
jgi:hypothetical protein